MINIVDFLDDDCELQADFHDVMMLLEAAFSENGGIIEGTTLHNKLYNRDLPDQHPISSITNLSSILDSLKIENGTASYWQERRTYVPPKGTLVVFLDAKTISGGRTVSKLKIGDGKAYVVDLPYIDDDVMSKLNEHVTNPIIHVTQTDRNRWDNKVSCYETYDPESEEVHLIFTKN